MKKLLCMCALAALGPLACAGEPAVTSIEVASDLDSPLFVTHAPDDFQRIFIVEQPGRIIAMDLETGATKLFMDIAERIASGGERGLLGLAFHPDFATNGRFYVNYTATSPFGDTVIAQFQLLEVDGGGFDFDRGDPDSELRMLIIDQPFSNHNGGWIGFAPDDDGANLYIATGDGGSGNDPGERAQDITNQLLGKMLRIGVDGDDFPDDDSLNYTIPPSNPFVGVTGDDEIWHYGLRNPWRNSFDRETGDFLIADVGQNFMEEVDYQFAHVPGTLPGDAGYNGGFNWGWDCMEGTNCIGNDVGCDCDNPALVPPIHTYTHAGGNCSITGGYVYRGCAIEGLQGHYFFADLCSNNIWSFEIDGQSISNLQSREDALNPPGADFISSISSFGEDAFGELYICDLSDGEVFKIVPAIAPPDCNDNNLSDACEIEFGLVEDVDGNGIPDVCEEPVCPADLDGSGTVDSGDLNAVLAVFGETSDAGDIDGDGDVDSEDLNLVLAAFGESCP